MRRRVLVLLLAAVALVSCGGSGDTANVEDLLDRAFSSEVHSADLKFEAELQVEGSPALERPLRIEAAGPFRTNPGKLPSLDLELRIGTDGGGQTVTTGFLSTGDRAFVEFQDVYYEQPRAAVRRINAAIAGGGGRGSLRSLGLHPRSWLTRARDEGEETVAGVRTRHVSGILDVEAVLRDVNRLLRRSGPAIDGGRSTGPLTGRQIRRLGRLVEESSFDVYVGLRDDVIRRVAGRVEFAVPDADRPRMGEIEGGTAAFSLELADVDGEQEIEAPAKARPLSRLNRLLGGGGLLGPLAGVPPAVEGDLGTGRPDVTPPPNDVEGRDRRAPDSAPPPDAEELGEYAECLDEARPEDTEALQRCAELLDRP